MPAFPSSADILPTPHTYTRDGYATVGQTDLTHAVMNEAGWADLKFYYVAGVDPAQARVIVRLTDSTPLLMEKQIGEGHVLLFASGFDNLTNDLPVRPAFVPFVDRTARYLSGNDSVSGSRLVDSFVPLRTAATAIRPRVLRSSIRMAIVLCHWRKRPRRSRSS